MEEGASTIGRRRAAGGPGVGEFRYDVEDPYDRAILSAMQLYEDYAEMRALGDVRTGGGGAVRGEDPRRISPRELEGKLISLRDVVRDGETMDPEELEGTVREVARALYAWDGEAEFCLPRGVWEGGAEDPVSHAPQHAPADLSGALALLGRMIRVSYETSVGGTVHQSEAARRLGLTPRGVNLRIRRGLLRHIKVGGRVLIPARDVGSERVVSRGTGRNLRMIGYAQVRRPSVTSPRADDGSKLTQLECVCGERTSIQPSVFKERGKVECGGCGAMIKRRNLSVYEMA